MSNSKIGNQEEKNKLLSGGLVSYPLKNAIDPNLIGKVDLNPSGDFEAGSYQTFEWVYTAGKFGIDDSGAVKICFRFASDQGKPQFSDPEAPNYTSVIASNNAVLKYGYEHKDNVRPWDKTIYINVVQGYLTEGDTIKVTFGDKSKGSPGMRMQTFCEESYEFHSLIDPIATRCYQPVVNQPTIRIIPGKPNRYVVVAPTLKRKRENFSIHIKGEDIWGNPSNKCNFKFNIESNVAVKNLPKEVKISEGDFFVSIENLQVEQECECLINFFDENHNVVLKSNPITIMDSSELVHFWGDLHGQSEETIGTGSADEYFNFAQNRAFLDVSGHQGNDFQITKDFWRDLNKITKEYNQNDVFITIPGYEWSGNTSLGGDRNVFFPEEDRIIRRSSHAMIEDKSDIETDCTTAKDLFNSLYTNNELDALVYAHCGGRYADIKYAHDGRFEKSVEIHSSWGTFEWILSDAFEEGYRVGIVGNSDGHKGRPGASYPGSSLFGAIGGLTCFLSKNLSREGIIDSINKRHHYATSGGPTGRMYIDLKANFTSEGLVFHDDPKLFDTKGRNSKQAIMGDIVNLPNGEMSLNISVSTAVAIERLDIFNGSELIETFKPFSEKDLGNRIRVIWEGAEYRGRFRQTIWDGEAEIYNNEILNSNPINFFNPDKSLSNTTNKIKWEALTTGNFGGFDLILKNPYKGEIEIRTPLITKKVNIEDINYEDKVFDKSNILPRFLKIFRLPLKNEIKKINLERNIKLNDIGDNPIFIRLTQEDGTLAWTSPIYVYRS